MTNSLSKFFWVSRAWPGKGPNTTLAPHVSAGEDSKYTKGQSCGLFFFVTFVHFVLRKVFRLKTVNPFFFIAAICIQISLSSCSPQAPAATVEPTSPPVASRSPEPAATEPPEPAGQPFTSERFGYSFEFPAGWLIRDKPGEWADFDPLDPNRTNGIDAFAGYVDNRNLAIGIGSRELPDGATLAAWVETAESLIKSGIGKGVCYEGIEDDPVSEEEIILDSEPAVLLQYECPSSHDSFGLVALAIHNQKGYWITWIGPQGNAEADRTQFIRILSTFSFTD